MKPTGLGGIGPVLALSILIPLALVTLLNLERYPEKVQRVEQIRVPQLSEDLTKSLALSFDPEGVEPKLFDSRSAPPLWNTAELRSDGTLYAVWSVTLACGDCTTGGLTYYFEKPIDTSPSNG